MTADCVLPEEDGMQVYVLDDQGRIWLSLPQYAHGMFTRADETGTVWSTGINDLKQHHDPVQFSAKWLREALAEGVTIRKTLCGDSWGPALGAGHTCSCNQSVGHSNEWHGCGCGAMWDR